MKVLDANVVIAFLDERNALHAAARDALALAEDEDLLLHQVTLAEVLAGPAGLSDEFAAQVLNRVIAMQIEEITHAATPMEVARLRARTGLPIPDCLVLLAAGRPDDGDTTILTFDRRLAAKGRELGYRVEP